MKVRAVTYWTRMVITRMVKRMIKMETRIFLVMMRPEPAIEKE